MAKNTHLQRLQGVVELRLAGAGGGRHGDRAGDGGEAPPELAHGGDAELVPVRGAEAVHDEVLVADVVGQVNPVDVSVCWEEKRRSRLFRLSGKKRKNPLA